MKSARTFFSCRLFTIFFLVLLAGCSTPLRPERTISFGPVAYGQRGIVASVHPRATLAGLEVLKNGGNAIDAAVAVALTLGVVDGMAARALAEVVSCLFVARMGRSSPLMAGKWRPLPRRAICLSRDGKADMSLSQTGPLASGVPGALAAYDYALKHFGRKSLKEIILPASEIAANGFVVDSHYGGRVKAEEKDLAKFASSRAVFFKPDGQLITIGDLFKQPDLAATYRHMKRNRGLIGFIAGRLVMPLKRGWRKTAAS